MRIRNGLATWLLALFPAANLEGQDPFEIQVYEYVTTSKVRWNLETHFNYTVRGTKVAEGTAAPTEGQTHLTFSSIRM